MAAIRFACPACVKVIKAGEQHAGRRATCPGCGATVQVSALAAVDLASRASKPSPASPVPQPPPPTSTAHSPIYPASPTGIHEPLSIERTTRLAPCPDCGRNISRRAKACPNCGWAKFQPNRITAVAFAWTLGGAGAHKFYLGKSGQGLTYLLLCWTFIPALMALLEGFSYLSMSDEEFGRTHGGDAVAPDGAPTRRLNLVSAAQWGTSALLLCMAVSILTVPNSRLAAFAPIIFGASLAPPVSKWIASRSSWRSPLGKLAYWGLCVFGAMLVTMPLAGLIAGGEDWQGDILGMTIGFCLLPFAWDSLSSKRPELAHAFTATRWTGTLGAIAVNAIVT